MKQILIAIDQLANALAGGWADETLSSRAHRVARNEGPRWPERAINALFFWEPEHCRASYESERLRTQAPPELRKV